MIITLSTLVRSLRYSFATMERINPERLQRQRASAELNQVVHNLANDGAKLKTTGRRTECVENAGGIVAWNDDEQSIRQHFFYPAPAVCNGGHSLEREKALSRFGR